MSVSKATVLDAFGWFKDLITADVQERIDAIEPYTLPTASRWQKGGVKIGDGLEMSGDTLICTISSGTLDLVTQTDNGLMRATDKVKLDGLADNAQENVIEAIWLDGTPQPVEGKIAKLEMSAYAKKSDVASGMNVKGSVNYFADLPTNAEVGDLYNVKNAGGVDGEGVEIQAGDNVVFTADGKWDVMAGLIDLSGYVEKVKGKQLSTEDFTTALKTKLDGLNNYELPTASETQKGGVMIGDGLSMDGETLNCTVKGETYSEFKGSTASTSGSKGLVPAPSAGNQKNFLCGDGTWADPSRFVTVVIGGNGSSGSATSSSVANIQGGLWQDLINGTPCLKLRYGDYEYNFYYDTLNHVGGADTPLDTSNKGIAYTLSTVPSSQDGNLWYEVNNNVPTLMFHKGAYNYGYNYDTITYKGSNSYLYAYLPFESTTDDALGNVSWVATSAVIAPAPSGGNALKSTSTFAKTATSKPETSTAWTIDFWLSFDSINFPQDGKTYKIFTFTPGTSSSIAEHFLNLQNGQFTFLQLGTTRITFNVANKRTHIAFVFSNNKWTLFINGTLPTSFASGLAGIRALSFFNSYSTAPTTYIDHLRIFKGQALWESDFTPPVAEDYLK